MNNRMQSSRGPQPIKELQRQDGFIFFLGGVLCTAAFELILGVIG
jgi:hypothetical protein